MIDVWINEEIEKLISKRNRLVILDVDSQWEFLIKHISTEYILLKTDKALMEKWKIKKEELLLRAEAESNYAYDKVIFYVTRPKDKMTFLLDYCYTCGCIDLGHDMEWIKTKIYAATGLQVHMSDNDLMNACQTSIGRDISWWKKIIQGLDNIVQVEKDLVPFLSNPNAFMEPFDLQIQKKYKEEFFKLLGQPYIEKSFIIIADELVKMIFNGLLRNDLSSQLSKIYAEWIDSNRYREILERYIDKFDIPTSTNIWNTNPNHCFKRLDMLELQSITNNINDKHFINEKKAIISTRCKNRKSNPFVPKWWDSILTVISFDNTKLLKCNSITAIAEYYSTHFIKIEYAIRILYVTFLSDKKIIKPIQEYYDKLNSELLDKWFEYLHEYKTNQKSFLPDLIKNSKSRMAVIVGDGIRYEIAENIANQLAKDSTIVKNILYADIPSETEHNMTLLYTNSNEVMPLHKDREKELIRLAGKPIQFVNLEDVNESIDAQVLVLTYKDIDSASEKLQQGALKLFDEFEKVIFEKIRLMLKIGYEEIYLITDHGFVLTGILEEADKIEVHLFGNSDIHERYIRTVEKQNDDILISVKEKYGEYQYINVAKSARPFKSKGVYGYAHGGFTPQEVIVPNFVFKRNREQLCSFKVTIDNKNDLNDVIGEFFVIKLRGTIKKMDIFSYERKVRVIIFKDNQQIDTSGIITLKPDEVENVELPFKNNDEVLAVVIDATTQEQLERVKVKKSNMRNLNGLFD